ncbi:hypothetical protein [Portibacter lacus]|uniref:Glycoside hydrolase family 65 n=1 Tax=Portibacter lacus TaxID=1099794 RepID=A0AA37WEM8_9BACT|nr:hypothetical protein [Portibacter lacus]GLR18971.1 hypothetical protein GCM10007940_35870 [Portibacter lacus]
MKTLKYILLIFIFASSLYLPDAKIDRERVVLRNNVKLTAVDTLGSLTVGNGEFAFTADITGLQSFHDFYENGVSLGTLSEWGWHTTPNPDEYRYDEILKTYESCNDLEIPIAIQHKEGRKQKVTNWIRQNPHRLHLGIIGFNFYDNKGNLLNIDAIKNPKQELDLWTGKLTSTYEVNGEKVEVITYSGQENDEVSFSVESNLLRSGQLKVKLDFPFGKECHVCPGYDWDHPEKHRSVLTKPKNSSFKIKRDLDKDSYYVNGSWEGNATITEKAAHRYEISAGPNANQLACTIRFSQTNPIEEPSNFAIIKEENETTWPSFWSNGGFMDFSKCTDARAPELERRVILSQYLTKVNCSGNYPPQETGLTMNSWYGKFHLEMHWWHGVHFAYWNRTELMEKSLPWYNDIMTEARNRAQRQNFDGVRWPKMTANKGISSPSSVGEFLIWQQPHPIYLAELAYRNDPSALDKYADIVFETADFMASFAQKYTADGNYHLCQPIIPAQEIFHADKTNDPIFESVYWEYALSVAQEWKRRRGEEANPKWEEVIQGLAPFSVRDGLYLPCDGADEAYTDIENRRDHPIVTGALGVMPLVDRMDVNVMAATFDEVMSEWNWKTTWGWDYPMLAMCGARLGKQDQAINALFIDTPKNTYLVNGHNYQDNRLRLYLPGNGALLTAVAMMAAGWEDGPKVSNPGFPQDGSWNVIWEDLKPML